MSAAPIISVEIELARNLVRTCYSGDITVDQMHAAVDRVALLLPKLTAGFAVLADWSKLNSMHLDCVPYLAKIMDLCGKHGVGLIVRVLPAPEKDIGINILSVVHYRGKVRTVSCDTLEEAERVLK